MVKKWEIVEEIFDARGVYRVRSIDNKLLIEKDVEGSYSWKPGEGSIVGTWSRSPADGLIHVFLETPYLVTAVLQDNMSFDLILL